MNRGACQAIQSMGSKESDTTGQLTLYSLLLTGSLTNNINNHLTHFLYIMCTICYILKVN